MNPGRGIALKIASTFVFTMMIVCVKAVADRFPQGQIVFARSFFALLPIVAMLVWQGDFPAALKMERPWLHFSRGVVGLTSMTLSFWALAYLPLPEAMMIGYAAPLIIVALAAMILGETVRLFRWSAVGVGFVGILIILWPRFTLIGGGGIADTALFGAMLALASAFFSAFAAICIRSMTRTESTGTIVFYFAFIASALSLLSAPFGWTAPGLGEATLLLATGLLGGVGQILMTASYRYAPAATLASFEYVSMIWGVTFGFLIFGDVPTSSVILGGVIVIAAGIFIIFRERALGLQRKRQRKAMQPPQA
jgi:drug/metabolite transporter (DMT)-like permease